MFIDIGKNNFLNADRLLTVSSPDSAPIKRLCTDAKQKGTLIDATSGRRIQSVLVLDGGFITLSSLSPEEINEKLKG